MTKPLHAEETKLFRLAKKVVPAVGLLVGLSIFVIAFFVANTDTQDTVAISNPAIDSVTPLPGAEVLRQSQVGIDLVSGWEAELEINGVAIPPDQVNVLRNPEAPDQDAEQVGTFDSTINRFLYQPLEGRAVPELKGDENCVVATFWPLSDPSAIESVSWCFTVA